MDYHKLAGPEKLWGMKRAWQHEFIREYLDILRSEYVLDIGCGPLRGGVPIIRYLQQGHYWGVDISGPSIVAAHRELVLEGLTCKNPTLLWMPSLRALMDEHLDTLRPGGFGVIWAWSVLIYLDADELDAFLELAACRLRPVASAAAYGNVFIDCDDEWGEDWQGHEVQYQTLDYYVEMAYPHRLKVEDLGTVASLGHVEDVPRQDNQHLLKFSYR